MLQSRQNDNIIKNLHERYLRLDSVSSHHRNIKNLKIELFKVLNNMHLKLLLIHFRNKHILSPTYDIIVKLELLQCELRITDLKVFDFLDLRYRVLSNYNLNSFKSQIRSSKPEGFPCRLCKPYLDGARIYKLKPSVISSFFKTSTSDIIHVSMSCELLEFCV